MVVVDRREADVVYIGRDIRVVVLEVRDGEVVLGIRAPKGVRISRAEKMTIGEHVEHQKQMDQRRKGA